MQKHRIQYLPEHKKEERTEDCAHQFPSRRQAQPQDVPSHSTQETQTRPWGTEPHRFECQNHWTQSPTILCCQHLSSTGASLQEWMFHQGIC